ncbi:Bacteriophage CI repressor helix-turn-helix domain-containing protein [Caldithrix abyssi DSM 13497]|nr:Bacteriophage CI repressor helix-turn-helix domain-containing protein [Caldithrix abyssi DSM 13497]
MSRKKLQNANIILGRLKKAYNLKKDIELANFLGVKQSTLATWKLRNTIDYDLIIAKCNDINLNWLLTGQGSMFLQPSPPPTVNEHAQAYQAKEQEIERLKQEITNLKAELKKMDQEEEKDTAHLQALQAKIRELELENRELIGQIKILKELLLKKA